MASGDPCAAFVEAACVPLDGWHGEGTLEDADAILAAHPELASRSIHAAAILGDDAAVAAALAKEPGAATAAGGRAAGIRSPTSASRATCGWMRRAPTASYGRQRRCSTPAPTRTAASTRRSTSQRRRSSRSCTAPPAWPTTRA